MSDTDEVNRVLDIYDQAYEALIERVKASDQWSFYQSRNLKAEVLASTDKILRTLSATPPKEDNSQQIARYEKEKETNKGTTTSTTNCNQTTSTLKKIK